jgi:hypothetical protein
MPFSENNAIVVAAQEAIAPRSIRIIRSGGRQIGKTALMNALIDATFDRAHARGQTLTVIRYSTSQADTPTNMEAGDPE